jgi:hypothetical protein
MWGAVSVERRVCRLQLLLALASTVILWSESRGTHNHILLSQILDSTHLEGQVPVFISRRNMVVLLYPQALVSLFFVIYDSQGYSGGIRTPVHLGAICIPKCVFLYSLRAVPAENTSSNNIPILACVIVATLTCRNLVTALSFIHNVTNFTL